jgi:hypothetical protein
VGPQQSDRPPPQNQGSASAGADADMAACFCFSAHPPSLAHSGSGSPPSMMNYLCADWSSLRVGLPSLKLLLFQLSFTSVILLGGMLSPCFHRSGSKPPTPNTITSACILR